MYLSIHKHKHTVELALCGGVGKYTYISEICGGGTYV